MKKCSAESSLRVCSAADESIYIATSSFKDFNEIYKFSKEGLLLWRRCYAVQSVRGDTISAITSGKNNSVTIGISAAYCVNIVLKL